MYNYSLFMNVENKNIAEKNQNMLQASVDFVGLK
jgi:hypothetical protein